MCRPRLQGRAWTKPGRGLVWPFEGLSTLCGKLWRATKGSVRSSAGPKMGGLLWRRAGGGESRETLLALLHKNSQQVSGVTAHSGPCRVQRAPCVTLSCFSQGSMTEGEVTALVRTGQRQRGFHFYSHKAPPGAITTLRWLSNPGSSTYVCVWMSPLHSCLCTTGMQCL